MGLVSQCENTGDKVMIKLHSDCEETIKMKIPDPEASTDYCGDYAAMMKKMELECGVLSDEDNDEVEIDLEKGYNKGRGIPLLKGEANSKRSKRRGGKPKKQCCRCVIS